MSSFSLWKDVKSRSFMNVKKENPKRRHFVPYADGSWGSFENPRISISITINTRYTDTCWKRNFTNEMDANGSKHIDVRKYVGICIFYFLRNVYGRPHYTVERIVDKLVDRYRYYRSSSKVQLVRPSERLVTWVWFILRRVLKNAPGPLREWRPGNIEKNPFRKWNFRRIV